MVFLAHSQGVTPKSTSRDEQPYWNDLRALLDNANNGDVLAYEVINTFLYFSSDDYHLRLWHEPLKASITKLIIGLDSYLYEVALSDLKALLAGDTDDFVDGVSYMLRRSQMLFEMHLEIFASMTQPSSKAAVESRLQQKDRLNRWASHAYDVITALRDHVTDDHTCRFLWASAVLVSLTGNVAREYLIAIWTDLQRMLKELGITITIPNSAAIPEVSAAAADREISKLTTMDFFLNLFSEDADPVAIIEALEPVIDDTIYDETLGTDSNDKDLMHAVTFPPVVKDMRKFLENSNGGLRLFLWGRLREAYSSVSFPSRVFSCHLKCLEIIVAEIHSKRYAAMSEEARQKELLGYLKTIDDLLVRALTLALNDSTAFDVVDELHLKRSLAAVSMLCRFLHASILLEDQVQVGLLPDRSNPAKKLKAGEHSMFKKFLIRVSEMNIRAWALQYTLIKEGLAQNKAKYKTPENDLAEYLAVVHYALGLRCRCDRSNRIFLKMMQRELIRMKYIERWEDYLGQVLWDLYGLRFGDKIGVFEIMDHGCEKEKLDKRTATSLMDHVIVLANRLPMKDLHRDELRSTIETMQQVIGSAKPTIQTTHNMRNINEYLKQSIGMPRFSKALKGLETIDTLTVTTPEASIAQKGWYFLLGMIALTKFRSVKRTTAGATDDLKVATTFFKLQLQYTAEHWEAWYRLGQCFDAELEEDVMWSSDKLNNDKPSIVRTQRCAILAYTMATSMLMRNAEPNFETGEKMASMFYDFGMRIYASSRDPFRMEAFYLDDFERPFSGDMGMYKKPAHDELTRYKAWRFAAGLFRRSLAERPSHWLSHYMLGKCLWKMWEHADEEPDPRARASKPTIPEIVESLERACSTCPKPRDSRVEPTLEPHYKIVSVLNKLVSLAEITPQQAADSIQKTRYAIRKGAHVEIDDERRWLEYVYECLDHLRRLDRSNWHHRFILRTAYQRYIDPRVQTEEEAAEAARKELIGTIFTKTMVVQVWKPEHERPGRHCVYMHRYVGFVTDMLVLLDDVANLEMLVKRVRKKATEYDRFADLWARVATSYLKVIRRAGNVGSHMEERVLKGLSGEAFDEIADSMDSWAETRVGRESALVEPLAQAVELRKLNGGVMKNGIIDDTICDAYLTIMMSVGRSLVMDNPDKPQATLTEEERLREEEREWMKTYHELHPRVLKSLRVPDDEIAEMTAKAMAAKEARDNAPLATTQELAGDYSGSRRASEELRKEIAAENAAKGVVAAKEPAAAATTVAKPKGKGAGRREVLRRAEMLVNKLHADGKGEKERSAGASSRRQSEHYLARSVRDKDGSNERDLDGGEEEHEDGEDNGEHDDGEEDDEGEELEGEGEHENGEGPEMPDAKEAGEDRESSPPGSVHDSADDESELSDVPDVEDEDEGHSIEDQLRNEREHTPRNDDAESKSRVQGTPRMGMVTIN
jgi:hypothetical protein